MKTVGIIGAGPAGLTAAYELLVRSKNYNVVVFEKTNEIGGISKTVNYKGNRMDIGGHRFFSKVSEVNSWWEKMLPTQGKLCFDYEMFGRGVTLKQGGPDPNKEDKVTLRRNRVSRILFDGKFYDYPITLNMTTLGNFGFRTTLAAGCSYVKSSIWKRKENSLEDFYINRFGKKLYSMFFEGYTENLWGKHPRDISSEWGAQRVKELSTREVLKNALMKKIGKKNRQVQTSLIEEFAYPKYGPGQLWEITRDEVIKKGGKVIQGAEVVGLKRNKKNEVERIVYIKDDKKHHLKVDYAISSMPMKELVFAMEDVPKKYLGIAEGLPYRDFITVGVLVSKLAFNNTTKIRTFQNIVPDNWIYVHDKDVKMGRLQIYNNWSPYLVKDIERTVWMGLEYFCNEGDDLWMMLDDEFADMAVSELIKMGAIESAEDVMDYHVERVEKAYPAYFGTYERIDELKGYLDKIPNLYLVGRNGQHRYNNIDHSMCTAFETVKNIMNGVVSKSNIWEVNTERSYHEV